MTGDFKMTRAEKAENYFLLGYNCAQAVVLAFSDVTGLDEQTAVRIAGPFGGGLGRLRETCGTVSGMATVIGLISGPSVPGDSEAKAKLYKRVQQAAEKFREKNGSIICRELLGLDKNGEKISPVPSERTAAYYKKRPCAKLCYDAAEILEELYLK